MTYKEEIELQRQEVHNHQTANKILTLMKALRMDATDTSERRWIWELIQNAKDVGYSNSNVEIEINLQLNEQEGQVEFSHNGQPFTVKNITYLIQQESSKDRIHQEGEQPKTTGKFGTGFLTTHLLSEIVSVQGVVIKESLPHKKFSLQLDRSGRDIQPIIESVNKSFEQLNTLDTLADFTSFQDGQINTTFSYQLNEKGIQVAKTGLNDFHISIPFVLSFIPSIKRIFIKSENATYTLSDLSPLVDRIRVSKVIKQTNGVSETYTIALLSDSDSNGKVTIAIPISITGSSISILDIQEEIPKLFCDFPLIGTNDFKFPVIINSSLFNPNEPRNGIFLQDKDEQEIIENKKLFQTATKLYFELIDTASKNNWVNAYKLAKIFSNKDYSWLSKQWYEETILNKVKTELLIKNIVDTNNSGRRAIVGDKNISFPTGAKEVRTKIWELSNGISEFILPHKDHFHEWYSINWDERFELTLSVLISWIHKKNNLTTLAISLNKDITETVKWLNEIYLLANEDDKALNLINQDLIKVIPNQNGEFAFKSKLFIDKGIDEELKATIKILGTDWKSFLVHSNTKTGLKILYSPKDQEGIINEINKILNEGNNQGVNSACNYLTSCFHNEPNNIRESIFNFSKKVFPNEISEKKSISTNEATVWNTVDRIQLKRISSLITNQTTVANLQATLLFTDRKTVLEWLDSFISFLDKNGFDNILNLKATKILPDQNGVFKHKDDLLIDPIEKEGEDLKDISKLLGKDIRADLLEKNIFPVLPEKQTITIEFLANEITKMIKPKFAEFPRTDSTKEIFKNLYLWFSKNKLLAEQIFNDLYSSKHKLYDDDEIAANLEKAELLDNIMHETNLSAKQITDMLLGMLSNKDITEILKQFKGVIKSENSLYPEGSEEDIMISPKLIDSSSESSRISISQDAKEIIFQELRTKGFNVPETIQINFTIVTGITSPTGKPIKLVVKSGKAGKIYFNPNEWLALTESDSQLFVVTRGNAVRNVTLADLETVNDIFHMRFNTSAFAVNTNLKAFANFFRYLKYTHFIFETPESTTDYLQEFGLSQRNLSASDLTADDKNLLH